MLYPAESIVAPGQAHLSALYAFNPRLIVAAKAMLAWAYDPWGGIPPVPSTIVDLTTRSVSEEAIASLNQQIAEAGMRLGKADLSLFGGEEAASVHPLVKFASWLSVGAINIPARGHLYRKPKEDKKSNPASDAMARLRLMEHSVRKPPDKADPEGRQAPPEVPLGDKTRAWGWLTGLEQQDLKMVTLWASFSRIYNSFLTKEVDTPLGTSKELYPILARLRKIMALLVALDHSMSIMWLREMAGLISSPLIAPFLQWVNPSLREEVILHAQQVLSIPVHPWLAEAERLRLPAARYTPWGTTTQTIGLTTCALGDGLWDRFATYGGMRNGEDLNSPKFRPGPIDMRDMILKDTGKNDRTPLGLSKFNTAAKKLLILRSMLDQNELREAESFLHLTQPSNPPVLHLHGQEWKQVIMTGSASVEALPDLVTLLTRPRFRLTDASRNPGPLWGGVAPYLYDASRYADLPSQPRAIDRPLDPPSIFPPLFVQPHRAEIIEGYGLGNLTARMFQPLIDNQYWGDEDANQVEYTIEALAERVDKTVEYFKEHEDEVAHLFTWDGTTFAPKHQDAKFIFSSPRTRQFWRTRVDLPTSGIPARMLALDYQTAPMIGHVQATVIRTIEAQRPMLSTLPVADEYAAQAIRELGFEEVKS
jgi:hypothetical protein